MKKILIIILGLIVIGLVVLVVSFAPGIKFMFTHNEYDLDNQIRLFKGMGGNSLVYKSADRTDVFIVDTKMFGGSKLQKAYVDSISPNANITIVNTHFHADHTGGNKLYPNAKIVAGKYNETHWKNESGMDKLPDIVLAEQEEKLFIYGPDTILVKNMGQAHTWNDVIVYFKTQKLLHTGDLIFNEWHPALIKENGADILKWIDALSYLKQSFDVETVVPGHGDIGDATLIDKMSNYFTSIKNAVGDEAALERLSQKYDGYFSMPGGMTGFSATKDYFSK